jgi:hypothetical protein
VAVPVLVARIRDGGRTQHWSAVLGGERKVMDKQYTINKNPPWENVHRGIAMDAAREGMRDVDVFVAWQIGLVAWKRAGELVAEVLQESEQSVGGEKG